MKASSACFRVVVFMGFLLLSACIGQNSGNELDFELRYGLRGEHSSDGVAWMHLYSKARPDVVFIWSGQCWGFNYSEMVFAGMSDRIGDDWESYSGPLFQRNGESIRIGLRPQRNDGPIVVRYVRGNDEGVIEMSEGNVIYIDCNGNMEPFSAYLRDNFSDEDVLELLKSLDIEADLRRE